MIATTRKEYDEIYDACVSAAIQEIADMLKGMRIVLRDIRTIDAGYGQTGFAGLNPKGAKIVVLCERSSVFTGVGSVPGVKLQAISVLRQRRGCKTMRWDMQGNPSTGSILEKCRDELDSVCITIRPDDISAAQD